MVKLTFLGGAGTVTGSKHLLTHAGKRILITGLLSNRSIAHGIAKACHEQGAELAFTYQNDRFKDRVTDMAAEFGSSLVFPCDVSEDAQIDALFASLRQNWDGLDGMVHAIAFAPRDGFGAVLCDPDDVMLARLHDGPAQRLGGEDGVVDDADSHDAGSPIKSVTACSRDSSWKLPLVR